MNSRDVLGQSPAGGIALMRLLRKQYPTVPAVFYSRKATVVDVKAALDAGALDVLIKPTAPWRTPRRRASGRSSPRTARGTAPAGAAPSANRALPHANAVDGGIRAAGSMGPPAGRHCSRSERSQH